MCPVILPSSLRGPIATNNPLRPAKERLDCFASGYAQRDHFVPSSTPFLARSGSKPLQLFGLRKTPELSLALLQALCLWAQRAQFQQRAVLINRPFAHSAKFFGHKGAGNAGRWPHPQACVLKR